MLRRSATAFAATSALVLTATAPALANHEDDHDPKPFYTHDGDLEDCHDLRTEEIEEFFDYGEVLFEGEHEDWNRDADKNTESVGNEIDEDGWWDVSFGTDGSENNLLNVEVEDGVEVIVIVSAGPDGANVFLNDPGVDLMGLYVPAVGTEGQEYHPTIGDYSICKLAKEDGDDGSTSSPTPTPTPTPTETTTPAAVPTEVPAGGSGSGDGSSMAPVGVAAVALMVLAGGAALLRRRFGLQS